MGLSLNYLGQKKHKKKRAFKKDSLYMGSGAAFRGAAFRLMGFEPARVFPFFLKTLEKSIKKSEPLKKTRYIRGVVRHPMVRHPD